MTHMTVKIRSFLQTDLRFILELLQQPSSEDRLLYTHYYNGDFLSWVQERKIEILVADDGGEPVGSVAYNDGFWGEEIEWLVVCDGRDRVTVEDALVTEAEKHVKRGRVFTAVNAGSPRAEEWMRRAYCPNGGLIYMVTQMTGSRPVIETPEGTSLRSLKPQEEKEFIQLVNAGFEWQRVKAGDIQKWKMDSPPFNEDWIQVAEIDGRLVSAVVAKPDRGYNQFFDAKQGYLGPAATLKECRGRNLASALTIRALNFLFEKGMDSACLYTAETNDASQKLLGKIGFRVGHNWKFMLKQIS